MFYWLQCGRGRRRATLLVAMAAMPFLVTSCSLPQPFGLRQHSQQQASTPLVDYLYGNDTPPRDTAGAELELPLVVGLAFLPTARGAGPTALEREHVLQSIRERFRALPYVRDIVIIPDYYVGRGSGHGFTELQQVASLQQLDVVALVSYDQLAQTTDNRRSLAYLTIAGAFLVRGNEQATHTLLDLAIVEPRARALLLRAGGTSSLHESSTAIELAKRRHRQQSDGFAAAAQALNDNFARELAEFERHVREGRAPLTVSDATRGGSGSLDAIQLLFLAVFVLAAARAGLPRRKR
jgi:rhombotail lipoprotein